MGLSWQLPALFWIYRYAGRMVLYSLNECEQKINAEVSNYTVGVNGNVDALLNSLSYEVVNEQELAFA